LQVQNIKGKEEELSRQSAMPLPVQKKKKKNTNKALVDLERGSGYY